MKILTACLIFTFLIFLQCKRNLTFLNENNDTQDGWINLNQDTTDGITKSTNIVGIEFYNKNTGFIITRNKIYKSINGGINWTLKKDVFVGLYPQPYDGLLDLDVVSDKVCWVVGSDGVMLKSNNEGKNWQDYSFLQQDWFTCVNFLNEKKGWGIDYYRYFYTTNDGGNNWEKLGRPGNYAFTNFQFINENLGWAIGLQSTGDLTFPERGVIGKTVDGGANWQVHIFSEVDVWSFNSISVIDSLTIYASGQSSYRTDKIIKTVDGGKNWEWINIDESSSGLTDLFFINANEGWAGNDRIFYTSDGGKNWQCQFDLRPNKCKDIFFLNNKIGWFVGTNGSIYKTTTGGKMELN